ncbi:reverse transcriptase domain-containing protein [Tanacetum coccineum]
MDSSSSVKLTTLLCGPHLKTSWQKVTQSFTRVNEITFPPLTANKGTEGLLVIEAEIGGHAVHRMYVDRGSSMELRLLVTIGDAEHYTKAWMNFMIVRSPSSYNGIIRRPRIRGIQAVPSMAHGMLKFPVNGGIVTIRSTILTPTECATIAATPKDSAKKAEARHENFKVAIHPDFPDQEITIGGTVSTKSRTDLCTFLKGNLDIFAWQPSDIMGVPQSIVEHRLDIREGYPTVRQKKRGQAPERAKAIQVEIQKLIEAGILWEVYYHDWLSNPIMVRKHDGSWRMCVKFTYLNKACPQDCYPLPEINWKMAEQDEEKIAFNTSHRVYCYTKIPFGLKNAGTTYQRLVDKAFDREIAEGMFPGYMISPEGIKMCPGKTEAVLQLPSPRTSKEVQSFNGKLASLNRFLFKSAEKSLPLFKTLKKCIKKSNFHWTPEAEQAFKQLKQHLTKLPMLVAPKPKKELIMYLSASYGAISAVLMTERDTVQTPVYFVRRALQAPELNYTQIEKLVLALVCAAKRLRRYFQAHPIVVITDQPIKQVISHPDMAGRLHKWSFMLGEHNITYRPRTSVKGQILADFLVEKPNDALPEASVIETLQEPWTLFTDGSLCVDGLGAGLILTSLEGTEFTYALRFQFTASNNEAEYKALIAGLRIAAFAHLSKQVLIEVLKDKSIQEREVATVVEEEGPTWMTPIIEYLRDETLQDDRKEVSKLRIKARQYELLEGILYRRSFLKLCLRCVRPLQADYVIRDIHEGSCNMHAEPRSVLAKAMRSGYYWPTMHRDAQEMIRKCKDCQIHRPVPRHPQQPLTPITTPWPFYKWGIDIAGPFLKGPRKIVSDNGKQFSGDPLKDWCEKLNIVQRFASVKLPQSNGLVERANKSLGEGIKARLGEGNKNWLEELPHVLWAHRTMIKSSNNDTSFSLTYGTEAVIPAKIRMPTYRTAVVDAIHNDEELRLNLDLPEERREGAEICEAKAKLNITKYYNARVKGVTFSPGDFVYRSNDACHVVDGGKLGPKWEGPYEVTKALGDGAYKLRSTDRTVLPRTWNIANLKKCYL